MTQYAERFPVYFLSYLLAMQPVLAQGVQVDNNAPPSNRADLTRAPNGVPVINIVRPNQAGISHNKFTDYNVSEQGLILNNSKTVGSSQLAGIISSNPNLQSGSAASLILNEITSTSASHLEGYTEVFGQRAGVIVANPNGITCDGCGFINTPRITLTTGVPEFTNGELANLSIGDGRITVEGGGLHAEGVNKAELLARAIEINADIHARNLSVVTGRNDYDYRTGTATAKVDNGLAGPAFAIDSTALGGMYADRITLLGTEAGVGFRLDGNMAASASDLRLTADGRIEMKNATAADNLQVASVSDSVSLTGAVNNDGNLSITAGQNIEFDTSALIQSGGEHISLNAIDTVSNIGGAVVSQGDMTVGADRVINDQGLFLSRDAMTLEGQDTETRATLIKNDAGVIETLGGDLILRTERLENLGTANVETRKSTTRHQFAQSPPPAWLPFLTDYISWNGYFQLWDEGRTQTHVFVPHPDVVEQIFDETGKTPDRWSENDWKNYAPKNRSQFDPEEWVVYVPDEAQHAPPGSAMLAIEEKDVLTNTPVAGHIATNNGGDLYIEAGDILNDTSTISSAGDLHIDGDSLMNRGINLRYRYSLGLSYANSTVVRALGWSREWFNNTKGPKLIINKSLDSIPATIAAGGDLTGSLAGNVTNLSAPVSSTDDLSFGGTSSTIIRTQLGESDPEPLFNNSALFEPASDTSNFVLETRFRYTDLGTFYGSDYFLDGLLGDSYDPDALPRRLGDAYYDTRSISQQIIDATGQRFLDAGLTADSDQIKRLLKNGIAMADDLKLSLGVALSPEQQEALTDNIVWYVEREYNGETVLVPQLYLTRTTQENVDSRAATISGRNVDIETATVFNADGRIKADEGLRLASAGDILVQGGRFDGGSVELDAGRDLAITTRVTQTGNNDNLVGSILDRRAGIAAENDLMLSAGRNLAISAADVKAGGDAELTAGNGMLLDARALNRFEDTTGIESEVTVARTIHETSALAASGNLSLTSTGDMQIRGAGLSAGRDLDLLSLLGDVDIDTVTDSSYSRVVLDKSDSKREHIRHKVTQRPAKLDASNDISIRSGTGNVSLRAAEIEAGDDINLAAGDKVALLSAKDRDFERETFQKDNGVWQKSLDRGHDIETVRHTLLTDKGELNITTGNGVVVEYEDTGNLDDSIDQLAMAPGLAWMAELRDRPGIDWQAVQAVHEQWHHEAEGLSGPAAALITTAVAIATQGMGASLAGLSAGTGTAAAANAGFSALVSQASVSLVNNQGDVGAALSDLASSEAARSMAVHALTAGLLEGSGLAAEVAGNTSKVTDNAVRIGLNVLAAQDPELGQALMFLYGNWGNAAGDWMQNAIGHGMQYVVSHELEEFAEQNGLTLGELNLFLALNSQLGYHITGGTFRIEDEEAYLGGYFNRDKQRYLGVIWDINDSLLNSQGLLDAVSLDIVRSGWDDDIEGHSLGAWRANNLSRQSLINNSTLKSLPLFAHPTSGITGDCNDLDFLCGGKILSLFRPGIESHKSPSWWNLYENHKWKNYP